MFRHIALLQFVPSVTSRDIDAIGAALAVLPSRIPQLRDYRFGRDLGLAEGNHEFAVVADFDDHDGYVVYRDDPEHQRILAELIRPVLASRAAVQYEC